MSAAPIVVAGAGIAGLATAIGLRQAGLPVVVVERALTMDPGGALGVQSNAVLALRRLGIGDRMVQAGVPVEDYVLLSWSGRELARWSPGAAGRAVDAPSVTVARHEVMSILRAAVPAECVRQGVVTGYEANSTGIAVHLADGSVIDAAVLVGADGVHSTVRRGVVVAPDPLRHAGYTSWRGTSPVTTDRIRNGSALHVFGAGRTFGMWPLPGGRTYWVATSVEPPDPSGTCRLDPAAHDRLLDVFAGAPVPVRDLLRSTAPDRVLRTPIYDRDPVDRWQSDRVVLIGDAAHPMQPTTGQGGAQALLDAVALVTELAGVDWAAGTSPAAALARFVAVRQPATRRVVEEARGVGRMQHVPHPVGAFIRNMAVRATPQRVWQQRAGQRVDDMELLQRAGASALALPDQSR